MSDPDKQFCANCGQPAAVMPREPTEEMIDAGKLVLEEAHWWDGEPLDGIRAGQRIYLRPMLASIWRAMLTKKEL